MKELTENKRNLTQLFHNITSINYIKILGNAGIDRYKLRKSVGSEKFSSRFSTQPVTLEEVQEASRIGNSKTGDESVGKWA